MVEEYIAADPGRRRAGAAGDRTIRTVIWMSERGER
jgi:hypothetical protein